MANGGGHVGGIVGLRLCTTTLLAASSGFKFGYGMRPVCISHITTPEKQAHHTRRCTRARTLSYIHITKSIHIHKHTQANYAITEAAHLLLPKLYISEA